MDESHEKLVPYDQRWKDLFEKEVELIKPILKNSFVDIQHIGSTAIPGLSSHPTGSQRKFLPEHRRSGRSQADC